MSAALAGDLREQLFPRVGEAETVELLVAIAWENQRGRLDQGLRPSSYADGMVCAVPERDGAGTDPGPGAAPRVTRQQGTLGA